MCQFCAGAEVSLWRRAWRDKILPAVAKFKPDLIIVSAGFDAHKKDILNHKYIGVTERDYYWITQQIVALANTFCHGRVVSALEGGYRIQGGIVSAFSRSVAAHVKALSENHQQVKALYKPVQAWILQCLDFLDHKVPHSFWILS